jgi:hypothetical protein
VTHDSKNHWTFGICVFGNEEAGERLLRRLERLPSFALNPLFASQTMASLVAHDLRAMSDEAFTSCVGMESTLGYWSEKSEESVDQIRDLARIPQSLNQVAIRIANLELLCFSTVSALDCLGEQLQVWPDELCPVVGVELQEQVKYLQQCIAHCLASHKRTKDGVQSMTQTVRLYISTINSDYV